MAVSSLTDGCDQSNLYSQLDALYQPAGLGSNGSTTGLGFYRIVIETGTINLMGGTTSGPIGSNPQPLKIETATTNQNLSLQFKRYTGQIQVVSQNPADLTADTKLVTIEFQIDNFGNAPSCSARIIGVLVAQ